MQEYRHNAWRVTQQVQDPSLAPSAHAQVQAEMKVAVVSVPESCNPVHHDLMTMVALIWVEAVC